MTSGATVKPVEFPDRGSLLNADRGSSFDAYLQLYHYGGRNVVTPGDGKYALRIHIAPPEFQRHDKENRWRYAQPVEIIFRNAVF